MKIKWTVNDGFVCGDRSRYLTIEEDEIEGMEPAEIEDYIDEVVREEFYNYVNYGWEIVE